MAIVFQLLGDLVFEAFCWLFEDRKERDEDEEHDEEVKQVDDDRQ